MNADTFRDLFWVWLIIGSVWGFTVNSLVLPKMPLGSRRAVIGIAIALSCDLLALVLVSAAA